MEQQEKSVQAVEAVIRELAALVDDREYAERLADSVMASNPVEQQAFRSASLAERSYVAARYLLAQVRAQIADHAAGRTLKGHKWQTRATNYKNAIAMEQGILQTVVAGLRAQNGHSITSPNPRRRALERLANENLAHSVPRGRFRQLLNEEEEKLRAARAAEAKRRKQEARLRRELPGRASKAPE